MSALHKDLSRCYWCGEPFKTDQYGNYTQEVGEFWNRAKQDSVLGHPDCTPMGIDAIFSGEDPVWKMA